MSSLFSLLSYLGNEALWDDLAPWVSILFSHVLDPQPVLSPAEYDALESPSEAFRKVTSEDILKMVEENRYSWVDGVSVSHGKNQSDRKQPREAWVASAQPGMKEGASFDARLPGAVGGFKEEEWSCV